MRKFIATLSIISLLWCSVLLFKFNYSAKVICYHLFLLTLIYSFIWLSNFLLSNIKAKKTRSILINVFNYFSFLAINIFYLIIAASNYFWGKTITLKIIKNYALASENILSILPVETWIFYAAFVIVVSIITIVFLLTRPRPDSLFQKWGQSLQLRRVRLILITGIVTVLVFGLIFDKALWSLKRTIHFSEEPLFQFALGPMWDANAFPIAFDPKRYQLGLNDNSCTDSISIPAKTDSTPLVVVIVLDALRNDHLSMYGYDRTTTPFLDSLYKLQKLFPVKQAFSVSNSTAGGVAGLFFSRDWNNFGYNGLSLMKFMKKLNYKTYAFLTGFHRDWYDLSAIYRNSCDYYYESAINPQANNDDDIPTLNEIKTHRFASNSFLYIHLLSTHTIGKKNTPFKKYLPDKINIGVSASTALKNNYDNGILQADYIIREIFTKLQGDGVLSNAIIFITSDHGELFGEDDRWSHGGSLHPQLLNIPLLIYDNNPSWYQNKESATIKDIAPTIAERLNQKAPDCWEGNSLRLAARDFTSDIESTIKTEIPSGRLQKTGATYQLDLFDPSGKTAQQYFMSQDDKYWKKKD